MILSNVLCLVTIFILMMMMMMMAMMMIINLAIGTKAVATAH
jgi:hypothetical protein